MRKIVSVLALPLILGAWQDTRPEVQDTRREVQDTRPEVRESQPAALKSLATLRTLTTPDNLTRMGFAELAEVETANLGTPLLDYMVWLGELRRYKPGVDPNKLLHLTGRVIYPVIAGGQIRSAIVMAKRGAAWDPVSFGGASEIRMLGRVRESTEKRTRLAQSACFVVRVPALNSTFIGYREGEKLMLVPILNDDKLHLAADRSESAAAVFERMVPAARAHDGLPH